MAKKRPTDKKVLQTEILEHLEKEKMNLMKENQRLGQENDLLNLQHLKIPIEMKTEKGRCTDKLILELCFFLISFFQATGNQISGDERSCQS